MTHKLLLADDSITIQRVIELTFSGEDVAVVSVGDGEQALERMRSERPDIVLADIAMPKRNGYDVAAYVRSQPDLAHVPVLLLAGAFEPVDQARAEAVQADGVLVKPFEPRQVVARVRELLRRGTSARRAISMEAVEEAGRSPEPAAMSERAAAVAEVPEPAAPPDLPLPDIEPAAVAQEVPPPDVEPALTNQPEAAALEAFDERQVSVPSEPVPIEQAAEDRPTATVPPPRPPAAVGAAVDEFFGRLGSAVASLGAARPSQPAPPPAAADDSWTYGEVPTVSALLDQPETDWRGADAPPDGVASERRPAPVDAFAIDSVVDDGPVQPARDLWRDPSRNVIAEAFHALLAAEQGGPRPVDPIPAPFAPPMPAPAQTLVLTDELVDRVTQRVLERLVPHAAREMVASIVSDVAERLVREEIARVKARTEGRS